MTLDYQYIDPGPGDPACTKNRYFALNVSMVVSGLLSTNADRQGVEILVTVCFFVCLKKHVLTPLRGKG